MISKVVVKLEVVIPYGGGIDKSSVLSMSVNKFIGNTNVFTVNRSPHGNKTARDQFKMVGTKYSAVVILDTIENTESLLNYLDNSGNIQGINSTYVQPSISYNINYGLTL